MLVTILQVRYHFIRVLAEDSEVLKIRLIAQSHVTGYSRACI